MDNSTRKPSATQKDRRLNAKSGVFPTPASCSCCDIPPNVYRNKDIPLFERRCDQCGNEVAEIEQTQGIEAGIRAVDALDNRAQPAYKRPKNKLYDDLEAADFEDEVAALLPDLGREFDEDKLPFPIAIQEMCLRLLYFVDHPEHAYVACFNSLFADPRIKGNKYVNINDRRSRIKLVAVLITVIKHACLIGGTIGTHDNPLTKKYLATQAQKLLLGDRKLITRKGDVDATFERIWRTLQFVSLIKVGEPRCTKSDNDKAHGLSKGKLLNLESLSACLLCVDMLHDARKRKHNALRANSKEVNKAKKIKKNRAETERTTATQCLSNPIAKVSQKVRNFGTLLYKAKYFFLEFAASRTIPPLPY